MFTLSGDTFRKRLERKISTRQESINSLINTRCLKRHSKLHTGALRKAFNTPSLLQISDIKHTFKKIDSSQSIYPFLRYAYVALSAIISSLKLFYHSNQAHTE